MAPLRLPRIFLSVLMVLRRSCLMAKLGVVFDHFDWKILFLSPYVPSPLIDSTKEMRYLSLVVQYTRAELLCLTFKQPSHWACSHGHRRCISKFKQGNQWLTIIGFVFFKDFPWFSDRALFFVIGLTVVRTGDVMSNVSYLGESLIFCASKLGGYYRKSSESESHIA